MAIASARELRGSDPSLTMEKESGHQMLRGTALEKEEENRNLMTKKELIDKTQDKKGTFAVGKKAAPKKKATAKKKAAAKKAAAAEKKAAKKAAQKKKEKKAAKKKVTKKATMAEKTVAKDPTLIAKEGSNRRWLLSFLF